MKKTVQKEKKKQKKAVKKEIGQSDDIINPKLFRMMKIVIGVLFLVFVVRVGIDVYDLKKQEHEVLSEKASLEQKQAELQSSVKVMNTPDYVEQQARNLLHMILPGEIMYIPDPNRALTDSGITSDDAVKN